MAIMQPIASGSAEKGAGAVSVTACPGPSQYMRSPAVPISSAQTGMLKTSTWLMGNQSMRRTTTSLLSVERFIERPLPLARGQ
jgi:hypothetical protein